MGRFISRLVQSDFIKIRERIVVKQLKSKGPSESMVDLTIQDVQRGFAIDSHGYTNDVVLFLRKNKKDRV